MKERILVAGIGNIFFGDDAFGCEVVKALARRQLPDGVRVTDFGIRSYDLAYAIMDGCDVTILVDASPRGEPPGTLYLIEPKLNVLDDCADEVVNAHSMNPVRVLQMVRALGGQPQKLYVVGCEPGSLVCEEGKMGLTERVRASVEPAADMIETLISDFLRGTQPNRLASENIETKTGGAANCK